MSAAQSPFGNRKAKAAAPRPPSSFSVSSPACCSSSYPYKVDYNDHFETPLRAYEDVLPLLDLVSPAAGGRGSTIWDDRPSGPSSPPATREGDSGKKRSKKRKRPSADRNNNHYDDSSSCCCSSNNDDDARNVRSNHKLYDPYYCAGRTSRLLHSLGFPRANIIHAKRDFYADVSNSTVPQHDTLITNPPYSADHKERCIEFAVRGLRERGRKFFLLMPSYVAEKGYYRDLIDKVGREERRGGLAAAAEPDDIVYVVPESPYEYDHPEGTGHDVPPFASLWFCGIGRDLVKEARELYRRSGAATGGPRIACSLRELRELGAVRGGNRKNPKQRRKRRQMMAAEASASASAAGGGRGDAMAADVKRSNGKESERKRKRPIDAKRAEQNESRSDAAGPKKGKSKKKKSKFRDADGVRRKKRF